MGRSWARNVLVKNGGKPFAGEQKVYLGNQPSMDNTKLVMQFGLVILAVIVL